MTELDSMLLPCFIFNFLLILVDASIGYHLAPTLFSVSGGEPENTAGGVRSIRRMLTIMVVLYMFFNCLAFFRYNLTLLLIVTALILFDLGGQLYVRHRFRQHNNDLTDHHNET